jgi:hypothetical protein
VNGKKRAIIRKTEKVSYWRDNWETGASENSLEYPSITITGMRAKQRGWGVTSPQLWRSGEVLSPNSVGYQLYDCWLFPVPVSPLHKVGDSSGKEVTKTQTLDARLLAQTAYLIIQASPAFFSPELRYTYAIRVGYSARPNCDDNQPAYAELKKEDLSIKTELLSSMTPFLLLDEFANFLETPGIKEEIVCVHCIEFERYTDLRGC